MTIAARTNRGKVREKNEDSLLVEQGLLMVADGMGGYHGSEIASRMAVDLVAKHLVGVLPLEVSTADIDQAFQIANTCIVQKTKEDQTLVGMGTTLTMCYIRENIMQVGHIGDSRGYMLRNGRLSRLTKDHSLVEELVRNGYISQEEALVHPHRHVITRALGTEGRIRVDHKRVAVQAGDLLLLCTDGIMLHIDDKEILEVLTTQGNVNKCADRLLDMALSRGGEDNITVIVALFEGGVSI